MTNRDIAQQRLHHQRLTGTSFKKPEEVVKWLGAVQSQDYAAAKWAIAQRANGLTDAAIDEAFNKGTIIRTHVMRPTWHFVTPTDIRWMLTLTAARVEATMTYYNRLSELDAAVFKRSGQVLAKALQGGQQLTRTELVAALKRAGIEAGDAQRTGLIMLQAELDGIVCSGGRRGKQFTYALLDERAPQTKTLTRSQALAELAKRFFQSHGPATVKDYAWWSGLTMADAAAGVEMIKPKLQEEEINGQTYWFTHEAAVKKESRPTAYLLSNFDEYTVGYADRSALYEKEPPLPQMGLLGNIIIVNGQITGTWSRTLKKDKALIETRHFAALSKTRAAAVNAASKNYGKFLGLPAGITR